MNIIPHKKVLQDLKDLLIQMDVVTLQQGLLT